MHRLNANSLRAPTHYRARGEKDGDGNGHANGCPQTRLSEEVRHDGLKWISPNRDFGSANASVRLSTRRGERFRRGLARLNALRFGLGDFKNCINLSAVHLFLPSIYVDGRAKYVDQEEKHVFLPAIYVFCSSIHINRRRNYVFPSKKYIIFSFPQLNLRGVEVPCVFGYSCEIRAYLGEKTRRKWEPLGITAPVARCAP